MMPERIWTTEFPGDYQPVRYWQHTKPVRDGYTEWVRADIHEAAILKERERCAQIAQRVADRALLATDGLYAGDPVYHYHEGMSYAAEEIADAIDARREEDQ